MTLAQKWHTGFFMGVADRCKLLTIILPVSTGLPLIYDNHHPLGEKSHLYLRIFGQTRWLGRQLIQQISLLEYKRK
jgi:hypothetical protein